MRTAIKNLRVQGKGVRTYINKQEDGVKDRKTPRSMPNSDMLEEGRVQRGTTKICSESNLLSTTSNQKKLVKEVLRNSRDFLASLSEPTSVKQCHPVARDFKDNFTEKKRELCQVLFNMYNTLLFKSKLPHDLQITWSTRMSITAGKCRYQPHGKSKVVLSTVVLDSAHRLRDTLLHELCHAAVWTIDGKRDKHGVFWRKWTHQSLILFPEIPLVTRLHTYKVSPKYFAKCMKCTRTRLYFKNVSTDTKRCPYCSTTGQIDIKPAVQVIN